MGSRGSFDIDIGDDEQNLEDGSFKAQIYDVINSNTFLFISYSLVIVALFLEDLRRAAMPWEADEPVQIISLLLFIFFLVELVLQIYVGMDFFYITLDAFATASLVCDFLPLLLV